ncbi:uncharacterized protein PFL1_04213 [Pseudozyma flocculosa PF-1]|uniref:F-box domain-containing protein n=2 Tax=Pseudozyma flocculosa TaxID=84751 RepID=A0A5C3EU37_9BASI|nr:uncharacterized protein PFL1_04213 [Pseudozyma flocculosa PF-1]EPQ28386.1 hypothetical protein PFL1_04213 [Pseudozyma flocculosa PF-1]SPO35542.1 uncharacterized protein PSFLO_01013 [Pseudozyma flocculosa]
MASTPDLPQEIFASILAYLDPISLSAASQANRLLHRIATHPSLWKTPYLLRWSTGDVHRERRRRTLQWRLRHLSQQLDAWARRANQLAGQDPVQAQTSRSDYSPDGTFLFFSPPRLAARNDAAGDQPDFYRLFLERIRIDQEVLDLLYHQVEATHSRIPAVEQLALRFGDDAKDVLRAVVSAQLSGPSGTDHGLPASDDLLAGKDKGKAVPYQRPHEPTPRYRLRAYDVHLPTTMRSDSHHLVILHRAREMLEHLQRAEAMRRLKQLDRQAMRASTTATDQNSDRADDGGDIRDDEDDDDGSLFPVDSTEKAISILAMFRGGELYLVRQELDVLAAACDLYLQSVRPDLASAAGHRADDGQSRSEEVARAMALAIGDFLRDNGFRGARTGLFQDLDNHFLHHCLETNRETIPLSLTVIFCAVANRLGLRASLCNFPTRILAVVNYSSASHAPDDKRFWLDVAEYTIRPAQSGPGAATQFAPILTQADLQRWIDQLHLAHRADFILPARPTEMVVRAARNIVASVQRAQILPRQARPGEGAGSQADAAEARRETHPQAGRFADGRERPDRLFLKLRHGWVPTQEQDSVYQLRCGTAAAAKAPPEDFAAWKMLQRYRSESSTFRASSAAVQGCPNGFAAWIEARHADDDWTHRLASQRHRASAWSEHDQQASMYAAANGFVRLTDELGDRGADWIAGLIQSYFPLDVGQVQRDFLGVAESPPAASFGRRAEDRDENHSESGSDSSFEGSFSGREERGDRSAQAKLAGRTYMRNPGVRFLLGSMMETVRSKDAMEPKVNPRPGRAARMAREARQASGSATEATPTDAHAGDGEPSAGQGAGEDEQEDPVTYRVGTLFRHRTYGYLACTLGWDSRCAAPEEWIQNMGVDQLPPPSTIEPGAARPQRDNIGGTDAAAAAVDDEWVASPTSPPVRGGFKSTRMKRDKRGGRHQPFYHSQVADGTRRYVAEVNVVPLPLPPSRRSSQVGHGSERQQDHAERDRDAADIRTLLRLRGLGEYFRCFDYATGRMRRNRETREMFPDDWSDDEGEGGVEEETDGKDQGPQEGGALGLKLAASPPPPPPPPPAQAAPPSSVGIEDTERVSEDGSW